MATPRGRFPACFITLCTLYSFTSFMMVLKLLFITPTLLSLTYGFAFCSIPKCHKSMLLHTKGSPGSSELKSINTNDGPNNWEDQLEEESRKRFEEISQQFLQTKNDDFLQVNNFVSDFPSAFSARKNPFKSKLSKEKEVGGGGKGSLYSDDELMNLLSIHNDISNELSDQSEGTGCDNSLLEQESSMSPSIHDLVKQVTGGNNDGNAKESPLQNSIIPPSISNDYVYTFDEHMIQKMNKIQAIASDVDGTILSKKQTIHPRTVMAIRKAIQISKTTTNDYSSSSTIDSSNNNNGGKPLKFFFPATGKSRKGALDSISKASIELASLIEDNCPGVYLQGLFCVDQFGKVVFEKKLNLDAIAAAEKLVSEHGVSIVAYDGDDLYTTKQNDIVIHLHEFYGEPLPVLLPIEDDSGSDYGEVRMLSSHQPSMHKLLIMDDDIDKLTNEVRPELELLASKHDACVTQALPTMLELLPKGCSKAIGVEKLCEALTINVSEELLAIGDAENDSEMLMDACIGVAVGNACPIAKDSADVVLTESNDEGGAGVAIELFALGNNRSF